MGNFLDRWLKRGEDDLDKLEAYSREEVLDLLKDFDQNLTIGQVINHLSGKSEEAPESPSDAPQSASIPEVGQTVAPIVGEIHTGAGTPYDLPAEEAQE